jgi:hypothetical protein
MQIDHGTNNFSLLHCTMTIETSGSFIAAAGAASYGALTTPL